MATRTIRVFLAYAEEDYKFRDLVVGQAKSSHLPVEFADMPAKQPWVPRWKAACRTRAFECDKAIVLISRKTKQGAGVKWEVVVDTEQALSAALSAAVLSKRTTVIGVRIDASGYVAQFNALREL